MCRDAECEACKLKVSFSLPEEIIHAIHQEKLVVFAGAGASTEGRRVLNETFYEEKKKELGLSESYNPTFSKLMTLYEKRMGRRVLLQQIKKRFDYLEKFPAVYRESTRFQRELCTILYIETIITTNWDDFFERECGAIPIVTAEDFAVCSDIPGRKVFKIHGSINNFGSIVATEKDYKQCYQNLRTGIIGSQVRVLLGSKVVVFVGYSFHDQDFAKLYKLLKEEVKDLLPKSYVVTLDADAETKVGTLGLEVSPILTDATYFISKVKERLVQDDWLFPDEKYLGLEEALNNAWVEDDRLSHSGDPQKNPAMIFSTLYQDGLKHGFETLINAKKTGEYSDPGYLKGKVEAYQRLQKDKEKLGRYGDVAYTEGYMMALTYLAMDDNLRKEFPYYYISGLGPIQNLESFLSESTRAEKYDKKAFEAQKELAERLTPGKELMFHHMAWY